MQAHHNEAVPRPSAKLARQLGRWRTATAAALVGAGILAVAAGTADAETRDPCADLAHRAAWHVDVANRWLAYGDVLSNLGLYDLAQEQYDIGTYFADAATLYYSDYERLGC